MSADRWDITDSYSVPIKPTYRSFRSALGSFELDCLDQEEGSAYNIEFCGTYGWGWVTERDQAVVRTAGGLYFVTRVRR